ncbi:MAG: DUF5343 domain-containing protein [Acidobacteriota bacterium]|nr:DUF5343 domain-containing protein [Acidobacteriota bacterium]
MEQEPKKTAVVVPPYLPHRTFENTLAGWKTVVPQRIDRSLLGSSAGSTQTMVLSTLKYFKLIDADGHPSERLNKLVVAEGPARQALIAVMVRESYPFLFNGSFDLAKATPQQLREKFEAEGVSGETKDKAISFFTALAKSANITLSPFVKTRQRRTTARKSTAKKPTTKPTTNTTTTTTDDGNQVLGQSMLTVALPTCGGSLTLSGTFSPFQLAGEERELVYAIIDKMNAFAGKKEGKK